MLEETSSGMHWMQRWQTMTVNRRWKLMEEKSEKRCVSACYYTSLLAARLASVIAWSFQVIASYQLSTYEIEEATILVAAGRRE
jgi:hypothetical protein